MAEPVSLVLGKYAPFHAGHEWTVRHALSITQHVVVVIYDSPSVTDVPLTVRSGWIRHIFRKEIEDGEITVLEAWDGPETTGYTAAIKRMQEEFLVKQLASSGFVPRERGVFTAMNVDDDTAVTVSSAAFAESFLPAGAKPRAITHFVSSEPYGEHVSTCFACEDVRLDAERTKIPVSGTLCRSDAFSMREYLHPFVYSDLITKVVFVGAPSTGKSTITERMAKELDTVFMPEYGREFWEKYNVDRRLTSLQLVELAEGHLEREDALVLQARDFLFVDTNAITTFMFGLAYHGYVEEKLTQLALSAEKRYDLVFLCDDDIPYDDTWDRSGDADRKKFQKQIRADLLTRRIPFIHISGNLDERVGKVKKVLGQYRKWRSMGDAAFSC